MVQVIFQSDVTVSTSIYDSYNWPYTWEVKLWSSGVKQSEYKSMGCIAPYCNVHNNQSVLKFNNQSVSKF